MDGLTKQEWYELIDRAIMDLTMHYLSSEDSDSSAVWVICGLYYMRGQYAAGQGSPDC